MKTCLRFLFAVALMLAVPAGPQTASAADNSANSPGPGVSAQYDGAHVYLAPADMDPFVKSFIATFGGQAAAPATTTVTPTPSSASFVALRTPVGPLSVLAFTTPIPYPFGSERVGYLVKDLDTAVAAAVAAGATVLVAPFADPIGRDAIVQWPGGVTMQFYWHDVPPSAPPPATIPEYRVYVSRERADALVDSFLRRDYLRRASRARNRDRPPWREFQAGAHRLRLRQADGARHRRPSAVSLWPGNLRLPGLGPCGDPGESHGGGRDRARRAFQDGRPRSGDDPVSRRLHRGDPYGFAAINSVAARPVLGCRQRVGGHDPRICAACLIASARQTGMALTQSSQAHRLLCGTSNGRYVVSSRSRPSPDFPRMILSHAADLDFKVWPARGS